MNTSSNADPTSASATSPIPPIEHELCGAQHPDEDVTCALVKNPWEHEHVGHRDGDEPLEQRTVTWGGQPVDPDELTVTISLSSYAQPSDRTAWRSTLEKALNRFSDEIFGAGGAINIGDCGRPWCTEMDLDGEGGEHARHHVSKTVDLFDGEPEEAADVVAGPWWAYLVQKPGEMTFETVCVVFSNDGSEDFELPVWQITVLRDLLERGSASRRGIAELLRQAAWSQP